MALYSSCYRTTGKELKVNRYQISSSKSKPYVRFCQELSICYKFWIRKWLKGISFNYQKVSWKRFIFCKKKRLIERGRNLQNSGALSGTQVLKNWRGVSSRSLASEIKLHKSCLKKKLRLHSSATWIASKNSRVIV